ncbi:hypothetical protein E4U42_006898 [Claviceps africana]|uniref:Uncharacterized protein n=1 Tax=Claviceps africana TaxID=83212 RepID=A0A8K0NNP8_9HYPO|nr:hypothetical protein E4U42_006898 [Claviceps africana]
MPRHFYIRRSNIETIILTARNHLASFMPIHDDTDHDAKNRSHHRRRCTPGGIGYALAREFHAKGHVVIATARRDEIVSLLRDDGMMALSLDVTDQDSITSCVDQVTRITGGGLDMLVNNAGLSHTIPAIDVDLADARHTFETNFFAVVAMVKAFSRLLIRSRGHIVNMSSLASVFPYVYGSVFCATKGALNSYSRTLRQELKPFGVRVTVVMAGMVRSQTNKTYRELPADSAYAVVQDLFRRKLTYSEENSRMTPDEFARRLVGRLLPGEGGRAWGRICWFASPPDWIWVGGWAGVVRLLRCFGERLLDVVAYRKFGMDVLEERLKDA